MHTDQPHQFQAKHVTKCIGHRGIRGLLPENTMEAFREAIRQNCDGLESDVRLTKDGEIAMLHDDRLELMTNGKGQVHLTPYHGGIDSLVTKQRPYFRVPTLRMVLDLLMEPQNQHLLFSVDCKEHSHPEVLFMKMHEIISSYPDYLTLLAPRLILGIWHIQFLEPAKRFLSYCQLHHLSCSTSIAREHFDDLEGFNLSYAILKSKKGQAFLKEAQAKGKRVSVWNLTEHHDYWQEILDWQLDMCTTDSPGIFNLMRAVHEKDKHALTVKRPIWTKLYRSIFLARSASLDRKWHAKMLRDVIHPLSVVGSPVAASSDTPTADSESQISNEKQEEDLVAVIELVESARSSLDRQV